MKAIFKLINSYYWKGFFGPFFTIFFPILILFLMGNVTYSAAVKKMVDSNLSEAIISTQIQTLGRGIVFGILVSTIISNGLIGFPTTIIEFKKSTLIKRIGSANINKSHFMFATIIYNLAWTIFSIIWVPSVGALILGFNKFMSPSIGFNMGLLAGLPFMFLIFLISVSIGFLIIALVNNQIGASSIANLIYFPISFLSGGFGTGKPELDYAPAIKYFTYLIPTKYGTDLLFNITENQGFSNYLNLGWEAYGYPIIAFVIIFTFLFISIKKFKWGE